MLGQVELQLNARSLRFFFKNLERLAREKGEISSGGRGIQARFGKRGQFSHRAFRSRSETEERGAEEEKGGGGSESANSVLPYLVGGGPTTVIIGDGPDPSDNRLRSRVTHINLGPAHCEEAAYPGSQPSYVKSHQICGDHSSLDAGVVEYVRDVALLVDRGPVESPPGRRVVVVVVVVVHVVRGLPHARGRGHHCHCLVVPDLAAAAAALQNCDEASPILFVEEGVEDRIDARVARPQPLGDRRGYGDDLVLPLLVAQLDHGEDHVEGQPREDEQYDDYDQHFHHLHLRFLLYPLHLGVLRVRGYVPPPHFDPDQDVAEGDEDRGKYVAQRQIADQEEEGFVFRVWPHLQAEPQVWIVFVNGDQVEEEEPRGSRGEGDEPDHHYYHSSPPLRYLTLQGPPDRQEPVDERVSRLVVAYGILNFVY